MSITPGTASDTAWYATSSQAWVAGFSTWTAWTLLNLSAAVSPATPLTARARLVALLAAATSSTWVLSTTLALPFPGQLALPLAQAIAQQKGEMLRLRPGKG